MSSARAVSRGLRLAALPEGWREVRQQIPGGEVHQVICPLHLDDPGIGWGVRHDSASLREWAHLGVVVEVDHGAQIVRWWPIEGSEDLCRALAIAVATEVTR